MNGIINVIKPPAMMSSGVVAYLRYVLHEKKIGHAGTLDPAAAGVLPICVGRATRLSDTLMGMGKTYLAEITFGIATDTLDAQGAVTAKKPHTATLERLSAAASAFVGEIEQVAPLYSAVQVGGKRLYALTRAGKAVEPPRRRVTVYALSVLRATGADSFLLSVTCSKGTYIRTLLADIAATMGEVAYTSFLLRTSAGGMRIEDAYTLDEIAQLYAAGDDTFLLPPDTALAHLPVAEVSRASACALLNGLPREALGAGPVRVYTAGLFLGVAEEGKLSMRLVTQEEERGLHADLGDL